MSKRQSKLQKWHVVFSFCDIRAGVLFFSFCDVRACHSEILFVSFQRNVSWLDTGAMYIWAHISTLNIPRHKIKYIWLLILLYTNLAN